MTKPTVRIHDIAADKIIDREMTDEEYAEYKENLIKEDEQQAKEYAMQVAKEVAQAKLAALGLTTEDLSALGL